MSKLALSTELARLQDGIGFAKTGYNTPGYSPEARDIGQAQRDAVAGQ
jgi:hypothetical protein